MNSAPLLRFPATVQAALAVAMGAGDGFLKSIQALLAAIRSCGRDATRLLLVDPNLQNITHAGALATSAGLDIVPCVSRAEDAVAQGIGGTAPIIIQVDSLATLANVLASAEAQERAVLAYILLLLPNKTLLAIRMVFVPGMDDAARHEAAVVFGCLARYARRSGREAVLGANAVSGHKLIEARLRHWISTHLAANLPKLVSGLDPTSGTLEVTLNGARTMSLFACHHPEGFWTPDQLASEFLANPPGPILRGEDVALVEIGPEGIRFHFCRVRGTDGQVAVSRGKAVGGGTPAAASESVLRAERLTVNDRNPVAVTD